MFNLGPPRQGNNEEGMQNRERYSVENWILRIDYWVFFNVQYTMLNTQCSGKKSPNITVEASAPPAGLEPATL